MNVVQFLATWGPVGYLNGAGTVASFLSLPFIALLMHTKPVFFLVGSAWILVLALIVVFYVLPIFNGKDSQHIVIDEVAGMFLTFLSVPFSWISLCVGFCLFRFFDITKWFGIKYFERLPHAWGVVFDDVAAGLLANFCLRAFLTLV